jgi:hypothetical protein
MASPWNLNNPDWEEMYGQNAGVSAQGAVNTNTAQAAEAALTSVSPTRNTSGQSVQGSTTTKTPTTGTTSSIDPANFGFGGALNAPSNQWYGGYNDDALMYMAADSPQMGADLWASKVLGLPAGSFTGSWLGNTFNPSAMGMAAGNEADTPEERLAQMTNLFQTMQQPGTQFFNPQSLVTSALQQLAQVGAGANMSGEFSQLNSIVGPGIHPVEQLANIVEFIGASLQGVMSPDALEAYTAWLTSMGQQLLTNHFNSGGTTADMEKGNMNMANLLLQRIGSSGGL